MHKPVHATSDPNIRGNNVVGSPSEIVTPSKTLGVEEVCLGNTPLGKNVLVPKGNVLLPDIT